MSTQTVGVQGMTCGHCVKAVTEEVSAIPGVSYGTVELVIVGASTVAITASEPLSDDAIRAAVAGAGYPLAPPRSLL